MTKQTDELKTLKNLGFIGNDEIIDGDCSKEELRAEAVKWVKNEKGYNNNFRNARADVLIEFFNLTEEDLK